jgi:hypothetical protein
LQNIKTKKCNTLPHLGIASVEPPWLETTHFQKCMYMSDVFWQSYRAHYIMKVLILWSWQKHVLCLCMNCVCVCVLVEHYIHTNIHIHIHTGSCCTHCDHGQATALGPCYGFHLQFTSVYNHHDLYCSALTVSFYFS